MKDIKLFYVTFPNKEEAKKLAQILLNENVIFCVNILAESQSIYKWEGKVQEDSEIPVLFKVLTERKEAFVAKLLELHSYDCPCLLEIDAQSMNPAYTAWAYNG